MIRRETKSGDCDTVELILICFVSRHWTFKLFFFIQKHSLCAIIQSSAGLDM